MEVKITVCKDVSHVTDLVTRRSVTGIVVFVRYTLVKKYSKFQNTVGSSSYESELMAMRLSVEKLLEIC